VADLSRDTDNANGHIDKIFDKEKIEEQQELAAVFGQMANQYAGDLGAAMGWAADGPEKAAIHGVIGAIQASFGGGNALAGGLAGMGSEALGQFVNDYLSSHTQLDVKEKAAITQWAAALGGAAVGGVTGGSNGAQSGAATALDSVRYNYLDHKEAERKKQVEHQLANGELNPEERQVLQQELADINATDKARDALIGDICTQGNKSSAACTQLVIKAQTALDSYGGAATYNLSYKDIFPKDYANAAAIMEGLDAGNITRDAAIKGIVESPGNTKSWAEVEKAYDDAMQLHGIVSIIAGYKVAGDEAAQGGKGSVKPEAAKGTTAGNKISYVEEPPFNPAGTGGAAQPWSTKGRIKYVELPTSGKIRYVPPEDYSASQPLPRGPNNGYFDKFGNEWVKGPSRTAGQAFEWDVQLSRTGKAQLGWATRDGSHLNISLDGKITHK
jgi:hypothetical protein